MRLVDMLPTLRRHVLLDGYDMLLDLQHSSTTHLVDALTGKRYLDFFSFFSSSPLGVNHPALTDPEVVAELGRAAVNKPSNADVYTAPYAEFVAAFARVLGDPDLPHLFFIDGGALAVENALKAAFDWKARRLGMREGDGSPSLVCLHLSGAFHGRSGYTLSLTNTDPRKTDLFPKFTWPRITTPVVRFPDDLIDPTRVAGAEAEALAQATRAFTDPRWRVACFLAEPVQGEGGDRHMRPEFLLAMQELCHRHDALFVLDEVQTGAGLTGRAWAHQHWGLEPDLVSFGKRTQVCGVMAGRRIDEVPDNVFRTSSRISSTWGGNLVDMVRATRVLEVIEREHLFEAATRVGGHLLAGLQQIAADCPDVMDNPRGLGLMCAFDLPDTGVRNGVLDHLTTVHQVLVLPAGERSIRFRPPLGVTEASVDLALGAVADAVGVRSLARSGRPRAAVGG